MNFSIHRFIEAGTVRGVHGLDGGLSIEWSHSDPDLASRLDRLFVKNERGDMEPYRIIEARFSLKRGRPSFFVQFDRITNRSEAEALRHRIVYLHPEDLPESAVNEQAEAETPKRLIGYRVVDKTGSDWGIVSEVLENPAHPILEISTHRSPSGSLLVPFVEHYIPTVNDARKELIATKLEDLILK
ncbi:MAG: ribosome maturation factor RimM [Balneolaceae bacterium]